MVENIHFRKFYSVLLFSLLLKKKILRILKNNLVPKKIFKN